MKAEVLNLATDSVIWQRIHLACHERELWHEVEDGWPFSGEVALDAAVTVRRTHRYEAMIDDADLGVARVLLQGSLADVQAWGRTEAAARELLDRMREQLPRAADEDPDTVPVTFWSLSPHGPQSIRRLIDAPAFDSIEENYPAAGELLSLLHDWRPGVGGQLLLWHGDAGTGKTTALRSLGREWREWVELHYIVDPDKFFGESAAYMMQVIMGGEDGVKIEGNGKPRPPTWRLLVLEDCAELLAPDARRDVGQALSRLLNACDGLIGRGLRLLILITTNEPLEKVHPAISRPGRCAARIEFERFTPEQAHEWMGEDLPRERPGGSLTLADLYALRHGHRTENGKRPLGFGAAR